VRQQEFEQRPKGRREYSEKGEENIQKNLAETVITFSRLLIWKNFPSKQ